MKRYSAAWLFVLSLACGTACAQTAWPAFIGELSRAPTESPVAAELHSFYFQSSLWAETINAHLQNLRK